MRSQSPVRSDMFWLLLVLACAVATVQALEQPEDGPEKGARRQSLKAATKRKAKALDQDSKPQPNTKQKVDQSKQPSKKKKTPPKELFRGTVVFARSALKQRGIQVAEEMKDQAVLVTSAGELIPIAADWRGRAFYQDKRLRDRQVELVGYRQAGIPYLQVLGVYMIDAKGKREEMDYWCDICSIPMYEIKDCECCQGEIRLRFRESKLPDYITNRSRGVSPKKKTTAN
jgi:hypothetical protein